LKQLTVSISYCASDLDIDGIIDKADEKLFQLVLTNPNHVLSWLIHDKKQINTTISEQDGTTDNLLTNAISSSVIL